MKKKIKHIGMVVLTLCLLTAYILPVYAKEVKTLYFEEKNGKMTWNNVRGDDGNWFMSFTNMVPGGKYEDQLNIENGSKKTYALYMQVIPLQQDQKRDELLELISMKVSLGNKLLYEGTASGKEYSSENLQNVIYLGTYKAGEKDNIQVNLELDKNVGLEYCDLLTKIDWKFMVTEINQPDNPKEINAPKTGDESNISIYIVLMGCAAIGIIMILCFRKKADIK